MPDPRPTYNDLLRIHPTHWADFHYVYPVISRRLGGLSIGVNLNQDKSCTFNCRYCQVDRSKPVPPQPVDLQKLRGELQSIVSKYRDLFNQPGFDQVPPERQRLRAITFAGDGEPTAVPEFSEALRIALDVVGGLADDVPHTIVLTNGCFLDRPRVADALGWLDGPLGQIWVKLDAGTSAWFQEVNRAGCDYDRLLQKITDFARRQPIVIQTMLLSLNGAPISEAEIQAYLGRLRTLLAEGGQVTAVQLYTVARQPADPAASAVPLALLRETANRIREVLDLPVSVHA